MTLIKLDSGDYINTAFVTYIGDATKQKYMATLGIMGTVKADGFCVYMADDSENGINITEADRDRIVEAINGPTVTTAQQDGLKPFTAEDFKHMGRGNE